ncbi:MAG: RHS repeat-associated core domain-containing protein [Planctomycetota bacterium]
MTSLATVDAPGTAHDQSFTYNAAGQITSATSGGGRLLTYTYNAQGERVGITDTHSADQTHLFAPAAQRLGAGALDVSVQHLQADTAGNLEHGYVYAGENPILRYDASGNIHYYLEDASDSIAALVNTSATKTAEYQFDAFGNLRPGSDPIEDFGFHAAIQDDATGLIDMRARSYDPLTGRFTSPDPAKPVPQSPETYHPFKFANNNPHLYSDPTGLFSIVEINIGQVIQSSLQGIRSAAIRQAKDYAKDQLTDFAFDLLVKGIETFIPVFGSFSTVTPNFSNGPGLAGLNFQRTLEDALASLLPVPDYLWLEPSVRSSDGIVENDGLNAKNLNALRTFTRGLPRPDFIVNPDRPSEEDSLTWLVGDIALSGNTLFKKYVDPGNQQDQWNAITRHARNQGLRTSLFLTFYKGSEKSFQMLQTKMRQEGFEGGDLVIVIAFKG